MLTAVFLSAVTLAAPVPKVTKPVGPPPVFVSVAPAGDGPVVVDVRGTTTVTEKYPVTSVENGVTVTRTMSREVQVPTRLTVTLENAEASFATADDKKLTAAEAGARLKAGGILVAPAEGDDVDPSYLKALAADAVVVTYTGKGTGRKTLLSARPQPHMSSPAVPTLVAVKANAKGVIEVPALGTKEETVQVKEVKLENGTPTTVTKEVKRTVQGLVPMPFDDVKPAVTTAAGKPVAADEAKKKLAAGAVVLVSGDGQPVNEVFRKLVRPDTLVLTSEKMILPGRSVGRAPLQLAVPPIQAK